MNLTLHLLGTAFRFRRSLILENIALRHQLQVYRVPVALAESIYRAADRVNGRHTVVESAGPAGATLQLLTAAWEKMRVDVPVDEEPRANPLRRAAARCWALLLVRIYECLPLLCPRCRPYARYGVFGGMKMPDDNPEDVSEDE